MTKQDFMMHRMFSDLGPLPNREVRPGNAVEPILDRDYGGTPWSLLPRPRGPLSAAVIAALQRTPGSLGETPPIGDVDPLSDDDFGLALYLCYEVHYRGAGQADWGGVPGFLGLRGGWERDFLVRYA